MRPLPILLAAIMLPTMAHAGWFGPSDYHECVVDRMKGAKAYLLGDVRSICREQFRCKERYGDKGGGSCVRTECDPGYKQVFQGVGYPSLSDLYGSMQCARADN